MIRDFGAPWLIGTLVVAQITAIVCLLARNRPFRYRAALLVAIVTIVIAAMVAPGIPTESVGMAVTGSCHAIAYISLLTYFAASLRPNREPFVTGIARRMRQTMPDKVVRYTRQVTIAWCAFFATQLVLSVVLLLVAPGAVWVTFITLLNLPLLAVMILAEFGYRRILFRHEAPTSLIETLSAMRHARFTLTSQR